MLKTAQFEWDSWNLQKNEEKHGISSLEAESAFFDYSHVIFEDLKHSTNSEKRHILYGKSLESRILMIGFTIRHNRIRIITARQASKKERETYEENKK